MNKLSGVSIVTSTNRPQFFERILANYKNQRYPLKELIIILNKDSMNLNYYQGRTRLLKNVYVFKLSEKISLGKCLNFAVSKTKYPYITKFDDDDFYAPYYLSGQMKSLHRTGADIVGKRAYFAYLQAKKLLIMRFPTRQNKFVGLVAGGTILFKRKIFNQVRFADLSLGEDVTFLGKCRAKGYKIYAPDPYNYVQIRRINKSSHTWKADDRYLLSGSRIIARTVEFKKYATRQTQ